MKIRNGFVSNSSSSSFILGFKGDFYNVVPKELEKLLKDFDLYSKKNLDMLTKKVQEDVCESMSEYKRRIITWLKEEADFWFRNLDKDSYSAELRAKWKQEDPKGYEEHEKRMQEIVDNPILVAEKVIQNPDDAWNFSGKVLYAPDFLKDGYKVCGFDLEYSGDYADEHKYPYWKELHKLTEELAYKIGSKYDCDELIIDTNKVKLKKVY